MWSDSEVAEYAKRVIALGSQQDKMFKLALDNKTIKDLIIFLNTDDQMGEDSVDSLGNALFNVFTNRGYYSANDPKGRAGDSYTLNDTGSFWDSFTVAVQSGMITIDANPIKGSDNLLETYGVDIIGLTDENLQVLINAALEHFIRWYKSNLLL